jgi:enoyl-CoA hydratase/carnithine racemase
MDLANFNPELAEESMKKLRDRKYGISNIYQKVVYGWRDLSVPVIAAVEGYCFGGGLQIMLGADIKYMHPETKCSILEMRWGIIPDMAGSILMRHSVRDDIIRELTYTNRVFSGTEAVNYGFATHVSETPLDDAIKLAEVIVNKNPEAIVKAKKLFNEAPYLNPEEGLINESKLQSKLLMSKNQLEAVFSEMGKRKPNFEDYR